MNDKRARTLLGIIAVAAVTIVACTEGFNGRVVMTSVVSISMLAGVEYGQVLDQLFG